MSVFLICDKHMYPGLLNTKQNCPWIKPAYILDTGKGLYQICKQHKDSLWIFKQIHNFQQVSYDKSQEHKLI